MAIDVELFTAPGKYEIDKSFEEVEHLLKQGYIINQKIISEELIKRTSLSTKDKYNRLGTK
jgi:hypothetical protein